MYILLKYSSKYSDRTDRLWFYSKEAINFNNDIESTDVFKPFRYKAKLLGDTVAQPQAHRVLQMQQLTSQKNI